MTFSTQKYLDKKTGAYGVGRFKYLQTLVTEFQDTHKQEHKKQILANLANFAYDPINYEHFRKLNILDIFLDVLVEEKDDVMIEFAMGGICNCCLDKLNAEFLTENDAVKIMLPHLSSANQETVLSTITALIYLMSPQTKQEITSKEIVDAMKRFSMSPDRRLSNLASIFLKDCCN